MRRLPVFPTLIVVVAAAAMIGLGIWQLQRAAWKERLLAEYAAAAAMPALDLDPLLDRDAVDLPPLAFRRVLVTCRARNVAPTLRGGRSRDGAGGYVFTAVPGGASGLGGRLLVNAGWEQLPDDDWRPHGRGTRRRHARRGQSWTGRSSSPSATARRLWSGARRDFEVSAEQPPFLRLPVVLLRRAGAADLLARVAARLVGFQGAASP
jgi:hypothetical protein